MLNFLTPWMTYIKAGLAGIVLLAIGAVILHHVASKQAERERQVAAAYTRGEVTERGKWQAEVARERARQAEINDKAVAAALAEVSRLREENALLEKTLMDIDKEADNDPNAGRPALSSDGSLRLNRTR